MTLTDDFKAFKRKVSRSRATLRGVSKELRAIRRGAELPRGNRWNTIGPTRRKLAVILTEYVRSIKGCDGLPRFPDARVLPEAIHPMRLAGKARIWEDAHCWEAAATWPNGTCCRMLMSYDTMTEIVREGWVAPIGDDGEVSAAKRGSP